MRGAQAGRDTVRGTAWVLLLVLSEIEGHIYRVMGLSSRVPHWPDQGAILMGHKFQCSWGQANVVRE